MQLLLTVCVELIVLLVLASTTIYQYQKLLATSTTSTRLQVSPSSTVYLATVRATTIVVILVLVVLPNFSKEFLFLFLKQINQKKSKTRAFLDRAKLLYQIFVQFYYFGRPILLFSNARLYARYILIMVVSCIPSSPLID